MVSFGTFDYLITCHGTMACCDCFHVNWHVVCLGKYVVLNMLVRSLSLSGVSKRLRFIEDL